MKIDLKNKKALVGGGSDGLGKASAIALSRCGAEVTLVSHNENKLKNALSLLDISHGQKHKYLVVDYNDFPSYQKIISSFLEKESIDILINNTQGPPAGNISEKNIEDYQAAFDLLFKVNCYHSLLAVKKMKNNGWGRIINFSSLAVKEPMENLVLSNTIRSAWQSWCKSLAEYYAPFGITVNTILTGLFDTERIKNLTETQAQQQGISFEKALENRVSAIPIQRLGNPKEYGNLVAFLASNEASYLTGTSIPLDGGATKGI